MTPLCIAMRVWVCVSEEKEKKKESLEKGSKKRDESLLPCKAHRRPRSLRNSFIFQRRAGGNFSRRSKTGTPECATGHVCVCVCYSGHAMNQIPSSFPPLEGVESVSEGFVVHVLPRASSAKEKRARTPLKDGHCMRASPALSLSHTDRWISIVVLQRARAEEYWNSYRDYFLRPPFDVFI